MARVRGLAMGIRADSSQLPQDLSRARGHWRRYGSDVEMINRSAATRVTEGLGRMRAALAGVGVALGAGAILGGFRRFADAGRETVATLDAIVKSSRNVALSTEAYQSLRFAFEQSGVGAEKLEIAVTTLNRRTDEAITGSKLAAESFERLGLSAEAIAQLDSEDRLELVIDRLGQMENATERTRIAQELFGRQGRRFGSIIEGGSEAINRFQRQAHETGVVVEGLNVRMEDLNDQLALNEQLFESSRQQAFADSVNLSAEAAREAERAYKAWGEAIGNAEANALNLKTAIGGLIADLTEGEEGLAAFLSRLGGGLGDQNVPVIPGQGIGRPRVPVQEPALPRGASRVDAELVDAIVSSVREQRRFFERLERREAAPAPGRTEPAFPGRGRSAVQDEDAAERLLAAVATRRRIATEAEARDADELDRLRRAAQAAGRRHAADEARLNRQRERESARYIRALEADNDNFIDAVADTEQFLRTGRTGEQIREAGRKLVRDFEDGVRDAARRAEERARAEREQYVRIGRALDEGVRQGLITAIRGGDFESIGDALTRKLEEAAIDSLLQGLGLDSYFEDLFTNLGNEIRNAASSEIGPGSGLFDFFSGLFSSIADLAGGLFGGGGGFLGIFHDGGVVPGPPSRETLALLRGGETVRTEAQEAALRSGGNTTIINYDIRHLDGPTARAAVLQTAPTVERRTRARMTDDAGRPSVFRSSIRR